MLRLLKRSGVSQGEQVICVTSCVNLPLLLCHKYYTSNPFTVNPEVVMPVLTIITLIGNVCKPEKGHNSNSVGERCYQLYFGCNIREQDKAWTPHICCSMCARNLPKWLKGIKEGQCHLLFPMHKTTAPSTWYYLFLEASQGKRSGQ